MTSPSLSQAEWDAWYERATAQSVAAAVTENGLLTSASIALGASEILGEAWHHLGDADRDRMLAIVREHAQHLVTVLRDLADAGDGGEASIDLPVDPTP